MSLNYSIALSGLFSAQKALNVTSNNIANAETKGYARQRAEMTTSNNMVGSGVASEIGSGVNVDQVIRIKDEYLIRRVREESSELGFHEGLANALDDVEKIFGENQVGSMTEMMKGFFNSWEELAKFPEQDAYRRNVIEQADQLSKRSNQISDDLNNLKVDLDTKIDTYIKRINDLAKDIAIVNDKIGSIGVQNPNALMDERDRHIDELAKYIEIETKQDKNNPNVTDVYIDGNFIVAGTKSKELKSMHDRVNDTRVMHISSSKMNPKSGLLFGASKARNEYVPTYENNLNELVGSIITEVNGAHQTGFGTNNATGLDFFTGTDASSIGVNPILENNPQSIATASMLDTDGNSDIARIIGGIDSSNVMSAGTVSPEKFWNASVFKMGSDLDLAYEQRTVHENLKQGLEVEKESIQGVNMDEELANMMEFQRFYQANAKMISTMDQTFAALFQMIG